MPGTFASASEGQSGKAGNLCGSPAGPKALKRKAPEEDAVSPKPPMPAPRIGGGKVLGGRLAGLKPRAPLALPGGVEGAWRPRLDGRLVDDEEE